MVKIITGQIGEGKTKWLIRAANEKLPSLKGHAVYIDSNGDHRYELSHQIRLIEAGCFSLETPSSFIAFLCGILSTNHDIEVVFIDELCKLTHCKLEEIPDYCEAILKLSDEHQVDFIIGTSCSKKDLPHHLSPYFVA